MLRAVCILLCAAVPVAGHCYDPKVNYQLNCMGCHLADGSGQLDRVPSIRQSLVPLSMMADGRNYIIRVPGVAQSPLSDQDTASLLNWMARTLSDVATPAGFRDFTVAEVRAFRPRPLAQVAKARLRLMSQLAVERDRAPAQ